ncbi:MAG: ATP-dependent Clp protease proteolytic subunit [Chloroflexi bacterium]|jgi:ATP-dependent Clp protease protease subunit|nr:ATP-dependent Clp protease proteolytic subunit [Dehalococcoidia bacterium]MCO5201670.1 ATP-dependent Clp protease proteolytic subunit [Chloroflexota bacterium]MCZ7576378.1 ATP-dependent Clp protease proteolytic subunit [Dehalococcoidia bacterium]NJD64665.1 ATP-dependent Clp protease proteolytic subunit [Chloroflexota bacterium]PWB71913.1 MAG: ATP-dependent Clp protease proteolytic subunit [Holophagae bacterium]
MNDQSARVHPLVQAVIPTVIETGPRSERAFDIFSLLLKERIVFLGTPIDDQIANLIVAQLLYLQREDPERDISMYIHSPGGVITAGLAIYDTMQLIEPDVSTIAVGQTASMATVLLCAGAKGKRFALPNATVHMHQALGGARGQATDIEIAAKEILRNNEIIRNIIARHTGQAVERVTRDFDRDFYLDAPGAKEYGFVDELLARPAENR